ncbi:MAG: hypothetical protein K2H85_00845 [Allobaculum sp.]|nr:hypothetical protein [Allobaculum sp.]
MKKVEANPINVGILIAEKGDSTQVASLFQYYGYTPQGMENGYQVMKHFNGNEMRYSFKDSGKDQKYPTIVVKTNASQKEIDAILTELKFVKTGNAYERTVSRYNNYITRCSFGAHNSFIIQRIRH